MLNREELNYLSSIELSEVNKTDLIKLSVVNIDTSLPIQQRIMNFLNDIENPYCFLVESSAVKIEFSNSGEKLQTLLKNHFIEHRNRTIE